MDISIGKFTLESLTTGMYSEPESCFREYIQNAVDSIDMAIDQGILQLDESRIEIIVDEDELAQAILSLLAEKDGDAQTDPPPAPGPKQDTFDRLLEYVREHFNEDMTQQELSERFFLNPVYISQLFRKRTGMTYQNYLTRLRIDRARRYLEETDLMVYEISERVGYSDTAYFSRVFEKTTGIRPTDYRKKTAARQEK